MSIKCIKINDLSSLIDFDFDLTTKTSINKYVVVFGTNGSGKSSLVDTLQLLNKYAETPNADNLNSIKRYLSSKISKESLHKRITIDIDFDTSTKHMVFDANTNNFDMSLQDWKKIKVFNDKYTNATIGDNIDINFQDNGLVIGEPNKELEKERTKHKELSIQKKKCLQDIEVKVQEYQTNFKTASGSSASTYLTKITKESFLENTCSYTSDSSLLSRRAALGTQQQEQKSTFINIQDINSFFDLDYWERLFNDEIQKPKLSEEYKNLLIKFSNFYENGIAVYDENLEDKCPYCLQKWDKKDQIIHDFQTYLTSVYNTNKIKINSLKNKLSEYELLIEKKNNSIKAQEKIVHDECQLYGIDYSSYSIIDIDQIKIQEIIDLIDMKSNDMEISLSIKDKLAGLQNHYFSLLSHSITPLSQIKNAIDGRTSQVRSLNNQLSEHFMKSLWEEQKGLREQFNKLDSLLSLCNDKITEFETKNEDINTIQEVFNGLLKFIGLEEYHLDANNKLQLKIDSSYDISNEGTRISTAQRKILSLCYFYAELISEVNNQNALKDYTIIYDDPLDSADYIFFHSITSLIENIEKILAKILQKDSINLGQHIVFTHNALLFNRLTQNFTLHKKIQKVDKKTKLQNADKLEDNYKVYLEIISDFYKKEQTEQREKIFIGNIIRRILEVIISFNELNSNNVSIIKDYGKPTLGLIANHLSHDSFSKVINPLPTDIEMKKACQELFELIQEYHPKQFEYIQSNLLN